MMVDELQQKGLWRAEITHRGWVRFNFCKQNMLRKPAGQEVGSHILTQRYMGWAVGAICSNSYSSHQLKGTITVLATRGSAGNTHRLLSHWE